jgi:undecaprenyl pyrophosphate phosphatase UppP
MINSLGLQRLALFMIANALLLALAELFDRRRIVVTDLSGKAAIWIGFTQALGLFPAVSRSAATLFGG